MIDGGQYSASGRESGSESDREQERHRQRESATENPWSGRATERAHEGRELRSDDLLPFTHILQPKQLQQIVMNSAIHAVAETNAEEESAAAQRGGLSAAQLGVLAGQVEGGGGLAKALANRGAMHGQNAAQMISFAKQLLQQMPGGANSQQPGQQLQEAQQPTAAEVAPAAFVPTEGAVAQEPTAVQPTAVEPAAVQPLAYAPEEGAVPMATMPTTVAPEEEYTYPAPEAAQAPAPAPEPEAGAHDAGDMWWWQKSPDDTLQLSWEQLIFILVLVVVVPCCTCTLVFRFCCRHHHIKQAPRDGSGGSGTGKTAFNASPHERGTMPSARGLDDYDERSQMGGGESTASMMPDTLKFLQQGMENLQGGLGDLADAAMNAAAMVSTAPFEEEDDSPYAVIVLFCRDAHGCLGVDAAHEIYDQCTARGLKTLLMPSDANWTKGSEYDMECLANVAASALFVALVDDDWVQEQAHLRFFAVAVRTRARTHTYAHAQTLSMQVCKVVREYMSACKRLIPCSFPLSLTHSLSLAYTVLYSNRLLEFSGVDSL